MVESPLKNLESLAQFILETSARLGADQCATSATHTRLVDIVFQDGLPEKSRTASEQRVDIRIHADGRYAIHSTSDLGREALENFIGQAVTMTRRLEPDPLRSLPDPKLYPAMPAPDLELYDPDLADSDTEEYVARARRVDQAVQDEARARDVVLVSAKAWSGMQVSHQLLADSQGFFGTRGQTIGNIGAQVALQDPDDGNKRRMDAWSVNSRRRDTFLGGDVELETARRSISAAARQFGARTGPTGDWPGVVENMAALSLVQALIGPLGGPALRSRNSFFLDRLGQIVAAPILTIVDDPLLVGGLGTAWFDAEGLAAVRRPIIDAGVLRHYYLNCYYSRVLKLPLTTGGPGNLVLAPSEAAGFEGLISTVAKGIAVTGFIGGNLNPTTGDFSYGIQGFWIEDGRVVHAVDGMNLFGNFEKLLKDLSAVGNDPYPYSRYQAPSLRFNSLSVSG